MLEPQVTILTISEWIWIKKESCEETSQADYWHEDLHGELDVNVFIRIFRPLAWL